MSLSSGQSVASAAIGAHPMPLVVGTGAFGVDGHRPPVGCSRRHHDVTVASVAVPCLLTDLADVGLLSHGGASLHRGRAMGFTKACSADAPQPAGAPRGRSV